jgi:hypothetical protein
MNNRLSSLAWYKNPKDNNDTLKFDVISFNLHNSSLSYKLDNGVFGSSYCKYSDDDIKVINSFINTETFEREIKFEDRDDRDEDYFEFSFVRDEESFITQGCYIHNLEYHKKIFDILIKYYDSFVIKTIDESFINKNT